MRTVSTIEGSAMFDHGRQQVGIGRDVPEALQFMLAQPATHGGIAWVTFPMEFDPRPVPYFTALDPDATRRLLRSIFAGERLERIDPTGAEPAEEPA
jgi:hypothetical protein